MTVPDQKPGRTELWAIALITLLGAAMRFAFLSEVAVEHFDEGVYASNLLFPDHGYEYPDRFLYAPPLLPGAIEWSMILFGSASWVPLLPGLVLGTLTVPTLWWTVRRWFDPPTAIAAASLCALSDFHIAMSRSALTDVPMLFFLLLAVCLIHKALADESLGMATVGGFVAGLAWATKYNGWLSLAIATSGTAAAVALDVGARRFFKRIAASSDAGSTESSTEGKSAPLFRWQSLLRVLFVVCAAAALTWFPVWQDVDAHGGYEKVSSNHARYVVGLSGWFDGLMRHEAIQRHYAGWPTWLGGVLAVATATMLSGQKCATWNAALALERLNAESQRNRQFLDQAISWASSTWNSPPGTNRILSAILLMSLSSFCPLPFALILSTAGLLAFGVWRLGDVGSLRLMRDPDESIRPLVLERFLGPGFCAAWLAGLVLATPLYQPYPRLLLPLMCVGWIGVGALLTEFLFAAHAVNSAVDPNDVPAGQSRAPAVESGRAQTAVLVGLLAVSLIGTLMWRDSQAWQKRDGLLRTARRVAADAASDCNGEYSEIEDVDFVVYVFAEPALLHHLSDSHPRIHVRAAMNLGFAVPGREHANVPTYVAAGPHAMRSNDFIRQREELGEVLEPTGIYAWQPSPFVLLDDMDPSEIEATGGQEVRLYRVRFEER